MKEQWKPWIAAVVLFAVAVLMFVAAYRGVIISGEPEREGVVLVVVGVVFIVVGIWLLVLRKKFTPVPSGVVQTEEPEHSYDGLARMAEILTNGNAQARDDMALLARGYEDFASEHGKWCDALWAGTGGVEPGERVLLVFAYWLVGYNALPGSEGNPLSFGAYIDWKEETEGIVWGLKEAEKNLGYSLGLDSIAFSGQESTEEALHIIGTDLSAKGFALMYLDIDGDCYHLFIIKDSGADELMELADSAGFTFVRL